jgi:hypothetical protein
VQARGVVLLHDEAVTHLAFNLWRRLGGLIELALSFVFFQGHREHHLTTETQRHREKPRTLTATGAKFREDVNEEISFVKLRALRGQRFSASLHGIESLHRATRIP